MTFSKVIAFVTPKKLERLMIFTTAQQVKDYIATLDPKECRLQPHYSSSYLWIVYHPESFGRLSFGFSSEQSLLSWANSAFLGENQ
jgi:hypothetical protein